MNTFTRHTPFLVNIVTGETIDLVEPAPPRLRSRSTSAIRPPGPGPADLRKGPPVT